MDKGNSLNIDSLSTEASIITLFPCDCDSSEENDYANLSRDSIDSSELVDDSDNEGELISEIFALNKRLDKYDEKNNEIISA